MARGPPSSETKEGVAEGGEREGRTTLPMSTPPPPCVRRVDQRFVCEASHFFFLAAIWSAVSRTGPAWVAVGGGEVEPVAAAGVPSSVCIVCGGEADISGRIERVRVDGRRCLDGPSCRLTVCCLSMREERERERVGGLRMVELGGKEAAAR